MDPVKPAQPEPDPLHTQQCMAALHKVRNELLAMYDGRVVFAALLAEAAGLGAALRVAKIYPIAAISHIFSNSLAEAVTIIPDKVEVTYHEAGDEQKETRN